MNESKPEKLTREDRLAAKLRENLRRRKAQTRELASESSQNRVSKNAEQS